MEEEKIIAALLRGPHEGLRTHELENLLNVDNKTRHRLRPLLAQLVESGRIEKAPGSRYRVVGAKKHSLSASEKKQAKAGFVVGTLRVHPAGYGFVVRDDGDEDVFVPARFRDNALDGDKVALTTWPGFKGTEGRVEEVLERGRSKMTGVLRVNGKQWLLEPDDPRLRATGGTVEIDDPSGGKIGQAVVAQIVRFPKRQDEPLGARVLKVLGKPEEPDTEIEKILITSDIPQEFPDAVLSEAKRAPAEVTTADIVDRIDLRDRGFMTIDPETARDFDDAICVEPSPHAKHMRVWVAVADVSHYVKAGSALDDEAQVRGCSVYLPDRAVPMLPKELSAGICSLNPDVDRMAMVVRLEVDERGGVSQPYFCAAVIRSRARFDYAGVAAALGGDVRGPRARYAPFLPELKRMAEVAARLRALRMKRGALDFELPEAKVVLDEDDPHRVRDVVQSRANPEVKGAYQMVEDFMLAANEAVARFFRERSLPTMWRVHAVPSDERLRAFADIALTQGFTFDVADGRDPRRLREVLLSLKGKPMERALNFMLLRALKQACYDTVNVGHFGLAAPDYLHFTSPIRRYPDLVVHRLLKHAIAADGVAAGGKPPVPPSRERLKVMAAQSSSFERRAMQAEREVIDLYRALFMRDRIGEEFDATIVAVAGFGFFAQIESPFVDGLVRIETLGDSFAFDESRMRLSGKRSGRHFQLGDVVRVRIENVSIQRRKIDLVLAGESAIVAVPGAEREWQKPERLLDRLRRGRLEPKPKRFERDDRRAGKSGKSGKSERPGKRRR